MIRRLVTFSLLIFILVIVNIAIQVSVDTIRFVEPLKADDAPGVAMLTVVLVPLDSRPACTQFVEELAHLANIKVVIPPSEIMDNYKKPSNKHELRQWLRDNCKNADAAIISTDMLVHGGLMASRLSLGNHQDITAVQELLEIINKESPRTKLYAFNIIPRLLIADNSEYVKFQSKMRKYSVLKEQTYIFENPFDINKLTELEQQIPQQVIEKYNALYEQNASVNLALIKMVEQNLLSGLVIGQDDGHPFGMPNLNKQKLKHYLDEKPELFKKVFITRGTDEVALTILGQLAVDALNHQPRIYVMYSHPDAPHIVMPYMPHSVAKTVQEKLALVHGIQVTTPDEADFTLYVHIGTPYIKGSTLTSSAKQIKALLEQGRNVALVDLSKSFSGSETILPTLITEDINIARLIAYAGWNTTSNSIGTAVTQASLFTAMQPACQSSSQSAKLYTANLQFLTARFLDDWYYLKEIQPYIDKQLKNYKHDPNGLVDPNYKQTETLIGNLMNSQAHTLFKQALYNQPILMKTQNAKQKVLITDLSIETRLPWRRTFEICLTPHLSLAVVKE